MAEPAELGLAGREPPIGGHMDTVEIRTIAKVTRRIVPFLIVCYFVAYLDRVNVGFAALSMNQDLGLAKPWRRRWPGPKANSKASGGAEAKEAAPNLMLGRARLPWRTAGRRYITAQGAALSQKRVSSARRSSTISASGQFCSPSACLKVLRTDVLIGMLALHPLVLTLTKYLKAKLIFS